MNDLIATDPIVSQNFFLEFDGVAIILAGVSGLDMEYDIVSTQQTGMSGKTQMIKTRGSIQKVADLSITRMAPMDAMSDPIWKWFGDIRNKGFAGTNRAGNRKNGSIVLYDSARNEVARFNFFNSWPSKISTDQLSVDSSEVVKESITLQIERLERVK